MQLNIYLPDSLGERVKAAKGFNVSAICRIALEKAISQHEQQQASLEAMERMWR